MSIGINLQDPEEIFRLLRKRKLWILGSILMGLGLAVAALFLLTPTFVAGTLVMVEPQKVPADYVKTTITSSLSDRLRTLEQQIKNRPSMENLINEFGLYQEDRPLVPMERLVERAREALVVRIVRNQLVEISFTGADPVVVADVANRVTELFIQENLRLREAQAENTTTFLDAELERTEEMLTLQEEKVAQFRLENEGSLPSQRDTNHGAISQLERRLEQIRIAFEDVELRIFLIERQPSAVAVEEIVPQSASALRLQELEIELQRLKSQYTDRHPDVVRLEEETRSLRQEMEQEARLQPITSEEIPSESDLAADPELDRLRRERERLEKDRQTATYQISQYQRRLEKTPVVEQELLGMTRDYNNLEKFYQSLLAKQIEARMAEELERQQQGEQFRILEPAVPPTVPSFPSWTLVLALGLIGGTSVGLAIAIGSESLAQTFSEEEAVRKSFPQVPHVIAIPWISGSEEQRPDGKSAKERQSA